MKSNHHFNVAVVGAGPAGLFAADELSKNDIEVSLFNRDIKPGGLAEYGIYPDKHQLKNGCVNNLSGSLTVQMFTTLVIC